jgi:hypothetical protein
VIAAVVVLLLAGLLTWLLLHRRNQQRAWQQQAGRLVRDTDALADLATAGPAGASPEDQVAHWSAVERRTSDLATQLSTAEQAAPNDAARQTVAGLSAAVGDYLTSVRTTRQVHIGPPAPTDEQLRFAEADSAQRLAQVQQAAQPLRQQAADAAT